MPRDVGVFTRTAAPSEALEAFLARWDAHVRNTHTPSGLFRTGTIQSGDAAAWVSLETDITEESVPIEVLLDVQRQMGVEPRSYVSIHFGSESRDFELALDLARAIASEWQGVIDYDGCGGGLDTPPSGKW